jgi:hypothetical protein
MNEIENLASWVTVIGGIGKLISKIPDLRQMFTNKFEKKAGHAIKQNVVTLMLRSKRQSDQTEEIHDLILKNVVPSVQVDQADWKMARQRIIEYKKSIGGNLELPLLIVSGDRANPVNLGAWMILGYYFDYRSQVNIIHVAEHNGKRMQYKMADWMIEQGNSIPFNRAHDAFDASKKYSGVAVYICCSERAVKEDIIPFENYLKEHYYTHEVYRLRYFSNESLTENSRFEEATREIEREIRSQVGRIKEMTVEPVIHIFMNVAAPMALSLGRQLGNSGNIQLYGFSNAEKRYYPAILLGDKNLA